MDQRVGIGDVALVRPYRSQCHRYEIRDRASRAQRGQQLAASEEPALIAQAADLTSEAIARSVFGAPFFLWRGEPFWGQDRLDLLEAAIASGRPAIRSGDP